MAKTCIHVLSREHIKISQLQINIFLKDGRAQVQKCKQGSTACTHMHLHTEMQYKYSDVQSMPHARLALYSPTNACRHTHT